MSLPEVTIYTDGACSNGYGGWASRLEYMGQTLYLSGTELNTTNNRMEIMAILKSLEELTCGCKVILYSDSQYALSGMTTWARLWKRNGWKNKDGKAIKNRDLWEQILIAKEKHVIKPNWVRGHNGDMFNEAVNSLAQQARKQLEWDAKHKSY